MDAGVTVEAPAMASPAGEAQKNPISRGMTTGSHRGSFRHTNRLSRYSPPPSRAGMATLPKRIRLRRWFFPSFSAPFPDAMEFTGISAPAGSSVQEVIFPSDSRSGCLLAGWKDCCAGARWGGGLRHGGFLLCKHHAGGVQKQCRQQTYQNSLLYGPSRFFSFRILIFFEYTMDDSFFKGKVHLLTFVLLLFPGPLKTENLFLLFFPQSGEYGIL